jgi:hypothetical protein
VLDENQRVPPESLKFLILSMTRDKIAYKNYDKFTYKYDILDYKFSSKIYEADKTKEDPDAMPQVP